MTHVIPELIRISERIEREGYLGQALELVRVAEDLLGGAFNGGGDFDDQPHNSTPIPARQQPVATIDRGNMDNEEEDGSSHYSLGPIDVDAVVSDAIYSYIYSGIQNARPNVILNAPARIEQAVSKLYDTQGADDAPQGIASALQSVAQTYYAKVDGQMERLIAKEEAGKLDEEQFQSGMNLLAERISEDYVMALTKHMKRLFNR